MSSQENPGGLRRDPSFEETANLLKVHLQKKHRLRRRSPVPLVKMTPSEVKAEAARILEAFLQNEIDKQAAGFPDKTVLSTAFQRVKEEDITEVEYAIGRSLDSQKTTSHGSLKDSSHASPLDSQKTTSHGSLKDSSHASPFSSSIEHVAGGGGRFHRVSDVYNDDPNNSTCESYSVSIPSHSASQKISVHSLIDVGDEIPFADDLDLEDDGGNDNLRSKSLPPDYSPIHRINQSLKGSKSLSPSKLASLDKDNKSSDKKLPVIKVDKSDSTPKSGRNDLTGHGKTNGESVSPHRGRRRFKSGSESESDTDIDQTSGLESRKKKSVFLRAKERFRSALSRSRERKPKASSDDAKNDTRKRKKRSKSRNKGEEKGELLQERHTHKHGHVEQHHYGDGRNILREAETWETTDITDQEHSKQKHVEKHSKVKESTDASASETGFINTIRRLTSRRNKKKSVPASKSSDFASTKKSQKTVYDRTISVPADGGRKMAVVEDIETEELESNRNGTKSSHSSRVVTLQDFHAEGAQPNKHNSKQRSNEVKGHHSKHTSSLFDRLRRHNGHHGKSQSDGRNYDYGEDTTNGHGSGRVFMQGGGHSETRGETVDGVVPSHLPRGRSFVVDYDVDTTEFRRRLPTGEFDTNIDQTYHQHTVIKDIEPDGLDIPDDFPSPPPPPPPGSLKRQEEPSQKDKEKLYGVIAERLAEIGDSYVSESEGATAASPHRSSHSQHGMDERDGDGLNSLEREIIGSLRRLGDAFSNENPVSTDATEAAVDIVKQATYQTFTETVKGAIGDEVGWNQIAMLFHVTKRAVKLAGLGGAVANKVKEMSLRYVEDKFAGWIVDQGGFDSVLEEESSDSELD